MGEWYSIEVLDGGFSAGAWADVHGDSLVRAALLEGVVDWNWHFHSWGCVLEVEFLDEQAWERFRALPAVVAALDAVPDPVAGLLIHPGRGGSSGTRWPRRPRPFAGAGAAAVPLPREFEDRSGGGLPRWVPAADGSDADVASVNWLPTMTPTASERSRVLLR